MSAGGHMSTMLSSIKNNKKRKHKTIFEGNGGFDKYKSKNPFVSPKNATPEEIKMLRAKLKADQKNRLIMASFIALAIIAAVFVAIIYLIH